MGASPWTPVDETAQKWTPVSESQAISPAEAGMSVPFGTTGFNAGQVVKALPYLGGAAGGALGTAGGPAGVVGGAALGGGAGEALKQIINNVIGAVSPTQTRGDVAKAIGKQATIQGAGSLVGEALPAAFSALRAGGAVGDAASSGLASRAGLFAKGATKLLGQADIPVVSPLARWVTKTRISEIRDALGDITDAFKSAKPPIPDAAQPVEKDILSQMTPGERTQLQKEIDDWVSGESKERLKAGVKGAAPDYVKLPAGWKIGDPVPGHYTGAEGTPNEADFEDLLKQSLQGRGVKAQ